MAALEQIWYVCTHCVLVSSELYVDSFLVRRVRTMGVPTMELNGYEFHKQANKKLPLQSLYICKNLGLSYWFDNENKRQKVHVYNSLEIIKKTIKKDVSCGHKLKRLFNGFFNDF